MPSQDNVFFIDIQIMKNSSPCHFESNVGGLKNQKYKAGEKGSPF